MFSIKRQMKKYLLIFFVACSAMSFAQFQDNVFEKDKTVVQSDAQSASEATASDSQSSFGRIPDPGDQEEGPGNPGEPVPVDAYIPSLLLVGLSLVVYYQRKNRKINI